MNTKKALDWGSIDFALIDLDDTLLDRHFEDYFWYELLPRRYAEKNRIPLKEAKRIVNAKYDAAEGTLDWFDLNYWAKRLSIDVPGLAYEASHLVRMHPDAPRFLKRLKKAGKTLFLVTNAHHHSVGAKMKGAGIRKHFKAVVSAFDFHLRKEDPRFWKKLDKAIRFDKSRAVMVDNDPAVLRAAQKAGIKHAILRPRGKPGRAPEDWLVVRSFDSVRVG